METLALELSEFTRRSRSVALAHSATTLTRGLEPGETVLIRDLAAYRSATVADVDFELEDTVYRLELSPELSAQEAFALRRDALLGAAGRRDRIGTFRLLALLRNARDVLQQAVLIEQIEQLERIERAGADGSAPAASRGPSLRQPRTRVVGP